MSAAEYADWQRLNADLWGSYRINAPCKDCPVAWRREQQAQGCCNRRPVGRPIKTTGDYAADRERARWRENSRRQREKRREQALQTASEAVTLDGATGRQVSVKQASAPPCCT